MTLGGKRPNHKKNMFFEKKIVGTTPGFEGKRKKRLFYWAIGILQNADFGIPEKNTNHDHNPWSGISREVFFFCPFAKKMIW